jgi:hypothetical protein
VAGFRWESVVPLHKQHPRRGEFQLISSGDLRMMIDTPTRTDDEIARLRHTERPSPANHSNRKGEKPRSRYQNEGRRPDDRRAALLGLPDKRKHI